MLKYLATKDELPNGLRLLNFLQNGPRKEKTKFILDQTAKYQTTRSSAEIESESCSLPLEEKALLAVILWIIDGVRS